MLDITRDNAARDGASTRFVVAVNGLLSNVHDLSSDQPESHRFGTGRRSSEYQMRNKSISNKETP